MASYKIIYRDETVGWQEGCPVEIVAIQVSRNIETAETYLQIKARNLSQQLIERIELSADVYGPNDEHDHFDICQLDIDLRPNRAKPISAQRISFPEIQSVSAMVVKANQHGPFAEPAPKPENQELELSTDALKGREIQLTKRFGIQASKMLHNAYEHHDGWFLCSCGTITVGADTCVQCGATEKELEELQDASALSERYRSRTNRRRRIVAIVATLVVAALIWAAAATGLLYKPFEGLKNNEAAHSSLDQEVSSLRASGPDAILRMKQLSTLSESARSELLLNSLGFTQTAKDGSKEKFETQSESLLNVFAEAVSAPEKVILTFYPDGYECAVQTADGALNFTEEEARSFAALFEVNDLAPFESETPAGYEQVVYKSEQTGHLVTMATIVDLSRVMHPSIHHSGETTIALSHRTKQ